MACPRPPAPSPNLAIHYSGFDDFRHGKRLKEVVRCLSKHPSQSVPQASESKYQSQSIYRLWANKRVKPEQIRASHRMSVTLASKST